MISSVSKGFVIALLCILFTACATQKREMTVADIERESKTPSEFLTPPDPKEQTSSEADIYKAYTAYVHQVDKKDSFRAIAISRLADLEFEGAARARDTEDGSELNEQKSEAVNRAKLERTLMLLELSLRDYPDLESNDEVLYRVAKTASQLSKHEKSIDALEKLARKYPASRFYVEAQFRLAEEAFVIGDYLGAEEHYSEVINNDEKLIFFEKAYFKRGWSRFKLQEYVAAIDDLMIATAYRDAVSRNPKARDELGVRGGIVIDEHASAYFYALALNFAYLENNQALQNYFQGTRSSRYAFHIYSRLADIYLAQKRYSDVVAVLQQFTKLYRGSNYLPHMEYRIVATWERSGFFDKFYVAADRFYRRYNPAASYWKRRPKQVRKVITSRLRETIVTIASFYHNRYQSSSTEESFKFADRWYGRYLAHYSKRAHEDNIFRSYADLLTEQEHFEKAIRYYEIVAYRNGIIVDERAAYATIVLSERLYSQSIGSGGSDSAQVKWRERYIKHAMLFRRTYPNDIRAERVIMRAAEIAFAGEQYKLAINLIAQIEGPKGKDALYELNHIKAESYYQLKNYRKAEASYLVLILSLREGDARKRKLEDRLALTIYKQAELNKSMGDHEAARKNFERIAAMASKSEIAPKGLYDATVLAMESESWLEVIDYGGRFRTQYADHKFHDDVVKMLSVAYLSAGQTENAAQTLEEVFDIEQEPVVKMAALWQSAELYESVNDLPAAIRAYQRYIDHYQEPFPQYMEALNKLVTMNDTIGDTGRGDFWSAKIRKAEHQADAVLKSDRTNHITAVATVRLARDKRADFDRLKIRLPLKVHMKKKKDAMDWARKLYTSAYEYHSPEVMTESLYSIAEMYYGFSQDVLNSSRPGGLNEDEMEQYEIGLEDLAFPVEEKAIEIYESNLAHLKQGVFNEWSEKSFARLKTIFPVRYARPVKVEEYADYAR